MERLSKPPEVKQQDEAPLGSKARLSWPRKFS